MKPRLDPKPAPDGLGSLLDPKDAPSCSQNAPSGGNADGLGSLLDPKDAPDGLGSLEVLIIGAGVGGLAAAIRLAALGHQVRVFERLERVGGKLNLLEIEGFRFDTGPSLVTLPWVFEDLFKAAGQKLSDHLELVRLEPICRYRFADGSGFDAFSDMPPMMASLEEFSPGAGEDFNAFFGHAARAWRGSRKPFLESAIQGPWDFVKDGVPWMDLTALLPIPNLHGLAKRFFRDPRMQQFIGRYATYTGSSPFLAPGTLSTVVYSEYAYGAWYVKGGLYQIAVTLEKIARSLGVQFEFGTSVSRILLEDATAVVMPDKQQFEVSGIELEDGRKFLSDAVICNADAAHLYDDLLEPQFDPRAKKLEPSLSGFVMMLGVDGQSTNLEHHNMFFSKDYSKEFSEIFQDLQPASDPSIYVAISSKSDPTQAPPGMENWFVLVNAPSTGRVNWQEQSEAYSNLILEKLAGYGVDIRERIRVKQIMTPTDLEHRYKTFRGGIYGTSSNTISSAFLRPQNRSGKVRGLYLASGSAHPGGGLPLVMLSGKLAVEMLIEDF